MLKVMLKQNVNERNQQDKNIFQFFNLLPCQKEKILFSNAVYSIAEGLLDCAAHLKKNENLKEKLVRTKST